MYFRPHPGKLIRSALIMGTCILGACSYQTDENGALMDYVAIVNDHSIAVHAVSGPDALISANGDLLIDGQPVALDATQRSALVSYYLSANALSADGLATGAAGAKLGAQALGSVATNLVGGNPDKIDSDMQAGTEKINSAVTKLCGDLQQLGASQESIAQSLPAFRPYARFNIESGKNCRSE